MRKFFKVQDKADFVKKLVLRRNVKDFFFISVGVVMASIGLKGFLLPNNFLDGGAMGVALLIEIVTHLPLSIVVLVVNLPFVIIGARQISWFFAIKSTLAILALSASISSRLVILSFVSLFNWFRASMSLACRSISR